MSTECLMHHHACNCREADYAAIKKERDELREWRGLVETHNASCAAMCDMDRCGYRAYFENNGRRCVECPQHSAIDIPAHLGATHV